MSTDITEMPEELPASRRPMDREIRVMGALLRDVDELETPQAKVRVVTWLMDRVHCELPPEEALLHRG